MRHFMWYTDAITGLLKVYAAARALEDDTKAGARNEDRAMNTFAHVVVKNARDRICNLYAEGGRDLNWNQTELAPEARELFDAELAEMAREVYEQQSVPDKGRMKTWMRQHVDEHTDAAGEVNMTTLAEACADALNCDALLDDPTSEIWEAALEVADSKGGLR